MHTYALEAQAQTGTDFSGLPAAVGLSRASNLQVKGFRFEVLASQPAHVCQVCGGCSIVSVGFSPPLTSHVERGPQQALRVLKLPLRHRFSPA